MLSEDEFERHFAARLPTLIMRRSRKLVIVSCRDQGPCPHWGREGCGIYLDRPIDCRVFPYIPTHVVEKGKRVKIVFHGRSDCPQKNRLFPLMPEAEIRALLVALGQKLYGETKAVVVRHEKGLVSRIYNRIEAALYRRLNRRRSD
jgi:Fe-S-cluster containining protein